MENYTATETPASTHFPLRTADGEWAKSDAQKTIVFADHFEFVFRPHPPKITADDNEEILQTLADPGLPPPLSNLSR